MKFTNGFWRLRDGYSLLAPAEVNDAREVRGALEVYAPVKPITDRGDTLNTPQISFEVSSPASEVLRVRISHFQGGRPLHPRFVLDDTPVSASIKIDAQFASISSGRLTARFALNAPWLLQFLGDDTLLTQSESKGSALVVGPKGQTWVKEELSLSVGENVYGLGERFGAFIKNGQEVDLWNEDGGTTSEQAYKNIPFYLTNAGYGVFINQPERVGVEVASEKLSRVQFSVPGETLEYFFIYGPTPKEILTRYTALTGRPSLPPLWSFGLWLTTSFTTSYDEKTVTGFIEGMAERGLPLSVFHFDCFWMREFHWSDFVWDTRTFPDPQGMLTRLKARGLKICVWINSYIAQRSELFAEGQKNGYLLKKPDGGVWQTDLWQAGMGIVDFTNPDACSWFASKLEALLDMGVDTFKTDFGERIPTNVVWADGSDTNRMHNYYPYLYNKVVFELLEKKRGPGEAVVFARSATAGSQRFPAHWGGDCASTFPAMAESLRGGLSLGLSGFGFWSHDIGGFEGTPPEALFHRWLAFGLLSSHSRLHGSSSVRVPWVYGELAVEVTRFFTQLKLGLMPYLFAQAVATTRTGVSLLRAMLVEFPDDPSAPFLDRQYLLGQSILVAPVFREDGHVDVWLPEGRWTHLLSGQAVEGPRWNREVHSAMSLPIYARPGSVIAFTSALDQPSVDPKSLTIRAFGFDDKSQGQTELVDEKGRSLGFVSVTKVGTQFTVTAPDVALPFMFEVAGQSFTIATSPATVTVE